MHRVRVAADDYGAILEVDFELIDMRTDSDFCGWFLRLRLWGLGPSRAAAITNNQYQDKMKRIILFHGNWLRFFWKTSYNGFVF